MSKVKKSIIVFVILLFTVSVYLTDQYIYSWTGWLAYQGGFCQSKLISLSAAKKDGFKSLPYPVDLAEITSKLTENPKYSVNSNEKTVTVSRNFDDFDYQIIFDKKTPENVYYRLSLNSKNSLEGEKCHTSNFEIYKKLTLLIDEIPLNDKARRMILSDLSIYYQNSAAT